MIRLPESLEQRDTIERMQVGEERWIVPWGMWADEARFCWLHPKYRTHQRAGAMSQMRIVRTSEGYIVDVARCHDHGWQPTPEPGYVGGSGGSDWLPVVELIGVRED